MISDSFFEQGIKHEVCEDYAVHGKDYAGVSDGCSNGGGSSIESDWGSRILCKAGESYIDQIDDVTTFFNAVMKTATSQAAVFPNLNPLSLTATLLFVRKIQNHLHFALCGDGFYGWKEKTGIWHINQIEFTPGGETGRPAPFYPVYLFNKKDAAKRSAMFGNTCKITAFDGPLKELEATEIEFNFDDQLPKILSRKISAEGIDFAFVGTDGLGQFLESVITETVKCNMPVSPTDVFGVLFDFLDFKNRFLRLQHNWSFKQNRKGTFVHRKWHAQDDVAVGAIYYGN